MKFESLWIPVTPQVFAPGPLTMPHSSHYILSKTLRLFSSIIVSWVLMSECPSLAWVHPFCSAAWKFFKLIVHSLGALGTKTTVLSKALMVGHLPFFFSYFTLLGIDSWMPTCWFSSCGRSFLSKSRFFFEVKTPHSSFKTLKRTPQSSEALMLTSYNLFIS